MKVGFLAPGSPSSVMAYSGVPFFAYRALEARLPGVFPIDVGDLSWSRGMQRINGLSLRLIGKRVLVSEPAIARARVVDRMMRIVEAGAPDVLVGVNVDFFVPLAARAPIVLHSDATIAAIAGYYPSYCDVLAATMRNANRITRAAYDRASFCTFASSWAARSAVDDFGQPPDKVRVIPYGANLIEPPPREAAIGRSLNGSCRFLFVGREWERKGGQTAFRTMERLLERGHDVSMVAVGCKPDVDHPRLRVIPFLNKQKAEEAAVYETLWRESHFLFQPSRQETFGIIYAEAAANGLPVVAARTGGVPDAVEDGVTGLLLPPEAPVEAFTDAIEAVMADPNRYSAFCRQARDRYEAVLNWDAWADRIAELAERAVKEARTR